MLRMSDTLSKEMSHLIRAEEVTFAKWSGTRDNVVPEAEFKPDVRAVEAGRAGITRAQHR